MMIYAFLELVISVVTEVRGERWMLISEPKYFFGIAGIVGYVLVRAFGAWSDEYEDGIVATRLVLKRIERGGATGFTTYDAGTVHQSPAGTRIVLTADQWGSIEAVHRAQRSYMNNAGK
jgi:hypothetical protein